MVYRRKPRGRYRPVRGGKISVVERGLIIIDGSSS